MMQSAVRKFLVLLLLAVAAWTAGCAARPPVVPAEPHIAEQSPAPKQVEKITPPAEPPAASEWTETGYAVWYGEALQGHRTASGEVFDYHKLTAAHRTLPFGSYVEVTRLDNGRSVIVKINDRGPFAENRIIDLSKEAASRIGMVRDGVAEVRLRLVRRAP